MLVLIVAVMKFSRFNNASYLHLYRLPPVGIGIIDEPCSPTCCGESCNVGLNQPLLAAFWPIDLVESVESVISPSVRKVTLIGLCVFY